jgi:hypothetical protein
VANIITRKVKAGILEQAIRWSNNMLVEAVANAELPSGEARDHLKKALEELALAQLKLKVEL